MPHRDAPDGEAHPLPELVQPGVRLLFVGFNPSIRSARVGHYYAGHGNRFWELLHAAGLTPRRLSYTEDATLLAIGIGITDLVRRPTRSAAEVTRAEYRAGAERLREVLRVVRPSAVCYTGKGVYLHASGRPRATWGVQPLPLVDGVLDFVAPSPSGLVRMSFAEVARHYADLASLLRGME